MLHMECSALGGGRCILLIESFRRPRIDYLEGRGGGLGPAGGRITPRLVDIRVADG